MTTWAVSVHREAGLGLETGNQREIFERGWQHVAIRPNAWRGNGPVSTDAGRFFVKGLRIPLIRKKQRWVQRWDIEREAAALEQLRGLGLDVPEVVAWGTERVAGISLRSFLITAFLDQTTNLEQWIAAHDTWPETLGAEEREILTSAGRTLHELHRVGFAHGDMASRNILVHPAGRAARTSLIDVPRLVALDTDNANMDGFRLVKTAMKAGLPRAAAALLAAPFSGGDGAAFVADVERIRAIPGRLRRKLAYHRWRRRDRAAGEAGSSDTTAG